MTDLHVLPRVTRPLLTLSLAVGLVGARPARAEGTYVGPRECKECHKNEFRVWDETAHAKSFRTIHRNKNARTFLEATSGARSMRDDATCITCHFTVNEGDRVRESITCERCHGAASEWLHIHNDYGGETVKKPQESEAHARERVARSRAAGMRRTDRPLEIATNCMACHGFAHPGVDAGILARLLAAGHPLNLDYELVKYSQGQVRHRFYPHGSNVNREMSPFEQARFYAIGQAAQLVSAARALDRATDEAYREAQRERFVSARRVLEAVPEAADLLADPTLENARRFQDAIVDRDLTGVLGSRLPSSYK